jgi:hypothetical protein
MDTIAQAKQYLAETDWCMLSDVELANKEAFVIYRKTLRNIIKFNNPMDLILPVPPVAVWPSETQE